MPDGSQISFDRPFQDQKQSVLLNVQVERALLGALLAKPALLAAIPDTFRPEHYGYDGHADVHAAVVAIGPVKTPVALAVMQMLALNDDEKKDYIVSLVGSVIGLLPDLVAQYADMVTDLYRRRQLVSLSEQLRQGAFAGDAVATAESTIALGIAHLDALSLSMPSVPGKTLNDAMDAAIRAAEAAIGNEGPVGLSTGFKSVDETLGGMEDGTVTVLAGRPAMGKSALGWQIAIHNARQGIGVIAISLEMSATELGRRALAIVSGVEVWRLKRGVFLPDQFDRVLKGRQELKDLPLTIEDGGGLTVQGIDLKVRNAHRKHGVGLIMIDHLHIIRPEDADAKHGGTWAVGRVSGAMKRMAKDHHCPVLLLAQLNRAVEGRDDKRPNMSDLRQSGDIEQDADAVALVYRAEYYLSKPPEKTVGQTAEKHANNMSQWAKARDEAHGKAELIFAKVRDGAPGTVNLTFHGETTSFGEAEVGSHS